MFFVYWISCLAAIWIGSANAQSDLNTEHWPPYHELSKLSFSIAKKDALFGYSIAYQKDINSLIVGSPLENIVGQVYTCSITETGCHEVPIDRADFSTEEATKWKHHSWLGAQVNAGRDFFMACAPRVLFKDATQSYGRCYYKTTKESWSKDTKIKLRSMERVSASQRIKYYKAAFMTTDETPSPEKKTDTFGLSSYVDNNETGHIFVGGHAMSIGQTMVYTNYKDIPNYVPVNNEALKNLDKRISFNFGYSITSGNFSGNYNQIAISTPYGTIGYGRIYFYRFKDDGYEAEDVWINGQSVTHIGSLFGASLASLGQDKGRSALLVGASAYAPSQSIYDVGAVFIYKFEEQNFETKTILVKMLIGSEDKLGGRFGASIVTVGDFDNDNIHEVAVAAPYEDDGKGAVYLYSGRKLLEGTDSKVGWMQKLLPEDQPTKQHLFGLALTVPADADQNGCNELAIGAPGISAVTLLHCLASVEVRFRPPVFPDLTEHAKTINKKDNSFEFQQCLEVKKFTKPDPTVVLSDIQFSINIIHPDVRINGKREFKERLKPGDLCKPVKVLLPKEGDYDREVMFNVSVELYQNPLTSKIFNPGLVLINKGIGHSEIFPLKPPLPGSKLTFKINTSLKNGYLIGSTESESLNISISNAGNLAHGACVRARMHGVTITELPKGRMCSIANGELRCFITKLDRGKDWEAQLSLSTKPLTSSQQQIEIVSELFKSNCNQTTDQRDHKLITLTRDSNIKIKTYSKPDFKVNVTEEELKKGKTVDHIYTITNYGLTTWTSVLCNVTLPPHIKIEKVQTQASVICKLMNSTHTVCNITELRKNIPVNINIHMKIQPDSTFVDQIKIGKATVDTELNLLLINTTLTSRITTILSLWEAPAVPLWMIVVASLFGLIIVVILLWVLHEFGFLQRTNKEKLKELKKDIKRQSMRKSNMLRQSVIDVIPNNDATNNGDRTRLISLAEEDTACQNGALQDQPDEDRQNVRPVKEFHVDDNDPARAAFNAELEKALTKGSKSVVTKADIH